MDFLKPSSAFKKNGDDYLRLTIKLLLTKMNALFGSHGNWNTRNGI